MDCSGRNIEKIAGLNWFPVDQLFNFAKHCGGAQFGWTDVFDQTNAEHRIRLCIEDIPAFFFAMRQALAAGEAIIRVHLNRELLAREQIFDHQAQRYSFRWLEPDFTNLFFGLAAKKLWQVKLPPWFDD